MMNLLLFLIIAISGVNTLRNGRRADAGEFPYVVSIQYNMMHLCSGTVISESYILTAGHAVELYPAKDLFVVIGTVMIRYLGFESSIVSDVILHPDYKKIQLSEDQNDLYWMNDLALLRLSEPLDLDNTIAKVSLSTTEVFSYRCFDCSMISWNYFEELNITNGWHLMSEIVHIVDNSLCNQWGIKVLENHHCFADLFETAFIGFEDIGSPIICGNSMVGFISKEGRNGVTASPATFLSTFSYSGFLNDVIADASIDVQQGEYPYIASIWSNGRFRCSGIIINAHQIMTAGDCVRTVRGIYKSGTLKVAVGITDAWYLDTTINYIRVHTITPYENDPGNVKHDIALLTVHQNFGWGPTVQRLQWTHVENFSIQQYCQVIFWKLGNGETRREARKLMRLHVFLIDPAKFGLQLGAYEFAAKTAISIDAALLITGLGSPIICGGHPLGFLTKVVVTNKKSPYIPHMIFHRIYPYVAMGFVRLQ